MFSVDFRKEFRVKRRKVSSSYAHIYVSLQRLIKVGKVFRKNIIAIYSFLKSYYEENIYNIFKRPTLSCVYCVSFVLRLY